MKKVRMIINLENWRKKMNKTIENLKDRVEHTWLMHREYIIGGVVGFVLGAIIF